MKKLLVLLSLSFCSSADAQFFSIGIKGGVPLTDAYQSVRTGNFSATAYDRRYIIGPMAEVHLPFHLGVEVDALYRRNGLQASSLRPFAVAVSIVHINDWQFPILGKWEPGSGPIRPFVDAGVTYRHISSILSPVLGPSDPNTAGVTFGGGVELKLLILRISPEIRYTHWGSRAFPAIGNTNQADFLVGLTF